MNLDLEDEKKKNNKIILGFSTRWPIGNEITADTYMFLVVSQETELIRHKTLLWI